MKNSLEGLNSKPEQAEKRISKLEDILFLILTSIAIIQSEDQ